MPEIQYVSKSFPPEARRVIARARQICAEFAAQRYDLTLRQLYYQFVAHDYFPDARTWSQTAAGKWVRDENGTKNAEPNYKWLGDIVADARLAGQLDWDYIVDRTRKAESPPHWDSPTELIEAAAQAFAIDKWAPQDTHVEVWIEKDALVGMLERSCPIEDVTYLSCRGYTSLSEIWSSAQRLRGKIEQGKRCVILHLGDHDPSGIDMTRDIEDRLARFLSVDLDLCDLGDDVDTMKAELWEKLEVKRIALTWEQIQEHNPPPNPAKLSDSRGHGYVKRYGSSSWELDALDPQTLVRLIRTEIGLLRDGHQWQEKVQEEEEQRTVLTLATENWGEVSEYVLSTYGDA